MRFFAWSSALVAICVVAACSAGEPPQDGTGGQDNSGSGGDDADGTGGSAGSGGKPPLDPPPHKPDCPNSCSNDLKNVVDCDGEVLEECTDGRACLDGACAEDACAVASASQSSVGCDYWALRTDQLAGSSRVGCFAVVVANTWNTPLRIETTWQGQALTEEPYIYLPRGQGSALSYEVYDADAGVSPGDVAILFIADTWEEDSVYVGCPMAPYFKEDVGVLGTARGEAFHVETTAPAAVYSVLPYGGGAVASTSASLLLPTGHWDREYIAVNAYAKSTIVAGAYPSLDILASEDDTTVDILPKVDILGSAEVDPTLAGEPISYQLSRGEYVQISQTEELTGSVIMADKPIAVWGGASCMNIPVGTPTCDSAHQQLVPVRALGTEYVGVRHRNRDSAGETEEESPWRIVAAVDETTLAWEPAAPPDAPSVLNQGDVYEFWGTGPFVVKSQDEEHPFYFGQYMTSATHVADGAMEGDPEWVNIVPPAQFLHSYVFFTDPTYPETSLVVTRQPASDGSFFDVHLDCMGALGSWQSVGDYEYTHARLVRGSFEDVGTCSNGLQRMKSEGRFGVTVWGWGTKDTEPNSALVSYAYPAGIGLRSVNEARLPPVVVR